MTAPFSPTNYCRQSSGTSALGIRSPSTVKMSHPMGTGGAITTMPMNPAQAIRICKQGLSNPYHPPCCALPLLTPAQSIFDDTLNRFDPSTTRLINSPCRKEWPDSNGYRVAHCHVFLDGEEVTRRICTADARIQHLQVSNNHRYQLQNAARSWSKGVLRPMGAYPRRIGPTRYDTLPLPDFRPIFRALRLSSTPARH